MASNDPTVSGGSNIDINALLQQALGKNNSGGLGTDIAGLYDIWNTVSGTNNKQTQAGINQYAFPNAPYVGDYASMLHTAMTSPGSYSMTPGAQFAEQQGEQAVARSGNKMFGGSRSGGTAIELEKYATGFAGQNYNNYINQLTTLSQGNAQAAGLFNQGKDKGLQNIAGGASAIDDLIKMATGQSSTDWFSQFMKQIGGGSGGGGGGGGGFPTGAGSGVDTGMGAGDDFTPPPDSSGFPTGAGSGMDTGMGLGNDFSTAPDDFSWIDGIFGG